MVALTHVRVHVLVNVWEDVLADVLGVAPEVVRDVLDAQAVVLAVVQHHPINQI